jgi:ribonuclease HII
MRKAYRWLYSELDSGRSRRSVLRRAAKMSALRPAVKEAFKRFDKLSRFDTKNCPQHNVVIGMDEVGRGPLAGPLVAACVQLPYPTIPLLPFLRDSKKLSAPEREDLARRIEDVAVHIGYGVVEASEFGGDINLHYLTFLAMHRALESLGKTLDGYLLVDGKFPLPDCSMPQNAVIKGDDTSLSIAAASVLAKVRRDHKMQSLHCQYPQYGFDRHVGYGTEAHRTAILEHGPTPEHRKNFLTRILTGSN